ncbi:glycosyltransferase [Parvularcula marina]|uniref:Glycosyltransferase n=2 Tax=Parvularcula marina TaxID=2292771 RepID=A0A371R7V1_9PROT|nr:glycosyltransferase [Parvularcula marina]
MLDIGLGRGRAANAFAAAGWSVSATGFDVSDYISDTEDLAEVIELHEGIDICDMSIFEDESFDVIWCAHVVEHVLDTGRALAEIRRILKPGGKFFISVPPFKPDIVGGHVKPGWNVGLLMYVLAVAGFDVRSGAFIRHGYNIFGAVGRGTGPLPRHVLRFANGDLELLQRYGRFPEDFDAQQGFDGDIPSWNWEWQQAPEELPPAKQAQMPEEAAAEDAPPTHIVRKRMKIAFFVPWITKSRGGTENVGQAMANAMAERGHEVQIFTFDNDRAPSRWPLDPTIRLWHLPEGEPTDDLLLMAAVAQANVELIVGLHMNRTFGRYVRCAHRLGLPVVLSEHIDPRFPQRIGAFTEDERLTFFSGATKIHLLVEAFRKTLPESFQDRIEVIPNTVPPARRLAEPAGVDGEPKTILAVCRLVPRKNVDQLIRAFAKILPLVPEWRLRIVGDGPELGRLQSLAKELGVADSVDFHGYTDDTYVCYEKAQIFCSAALFEGFPMTTLEAMAHGLPCVGFAACNEIYELISCGETGFVFSDRVAHQSLEARLIELTQGRELRNRMGKSGLNKYTEEFGENYVLDKWESLFFKAVCGGLKYLSTELIEVHEDRLNSFAFASDDEMLN